MDRYGRTLSPSIRRPSSVALALLLIPFTITALSVPFAMAPCGSSPARNCVSPSPFPSSSVSLCISVSPVIGCRLSSLSGAMNAPSLRSLTTLASYNGNHPEEYNESNPTEPLPLPYKEGSHNSVHITVPEPNLEIDRDPNHPHDYYHHHPSPSVFRRRLEATVLACRRRSKSSLWIKVPMSRAAVIEAVADVEGLEFHHAEGRFAYLCVWLRDDVDCKIPEYGTHQVVGVVYLLLTSMLFLLPVLCCVMLCCVMLCYAVSSVTVTLCLSHLPPSLPPSLSHKLFSFSFSCNNKHHTAHRE